MNHNIGATVIFSRSDDLQYLRGLLAEVKIDLCDEISMKTAKKLVKADAIDLLIEDACTVLFVTKHLTSKYLNRILNHHRQLQTICLGTACSWDPERLSMYQTTLLPSHKMYHVEQMQKFLHEHVLKDVA
jgi:hypothetical protein